MTIAPPRFRYMGFMEARGARIFNFQTSPSEGAKCNIAVTSDLALVRLYNMALQELPLLCRLVLEEQAGTVKSCNLSEDQIKTHSGRVAERDEQTKRKGSTRRPQTVQGPVDTGWKIPVNLVNGGRP